MVKLPRTLPVIIIAAGALFLSAAGGAVAGTMITGAQIQDNTVTSKDIKTSTLKLSDISTAAKLALRGNTGPAGPQGAQGPQGPQGTPGTTGAQGTPGTPGTPGTNGTPGTPGTNGTNGTNGVTALEIVVGDFLVGAGGDGVATATCPGAKKAIGISGEFTSGYEGVQTSIFTNSGASYGHNSSASSRNLRVKVVCALVTP
jgi:hypothetical protein